MIGRAIGFTIFFFLIALIDAIIAGGIFLYFSGNLHQLGGVDYTGDIPAVIRLIILGLMIFVTAALGGMALDVLHSQFLTRNSPRGKADR